MKKLENRAAICLLLATVLFMGIVIFVWRFITQGAEWASFYGNTQIYTNGEINRGTILDRNGTLLLKCATDGVHYNDSQTIREATLHAVGDPKGNVSTGAINMWKSELIGYDILNGTYDTTAEGKTITLNIDANVNAVAYNALGGYTGTVGVFNYKTGEIVCMVSTPTFDPAGSLPTDTSSPYYFNTFLQGLQTPGSIFKLLTSAAAWDTVEDIETFSFTCDGSNNYEGINIACHNGEVHGTVGFESALADSCNGAFGSITREVGAKNMKEYVQKCGLTDSINVDGIETPAGSFTFPEQDPVSLSWAGIGQYEDLVNPCAMMVYVGAIANEGEAVQPTLIKNSNFLKKIGGGKSLGNYLSKSTANKLKSMMKNNVEQTYGTWMFPGLDMYGKSGTAEVGNGVNNCWFVGFIGNEGCPYAFVVWVEDGVTGSATAAPIACKVMQAVAGL